MFFEDKAGLGRPTTASPNLCSSTSMSSNLAHPSLGRNTNRQPRIPPVIPLFVMPWPFLEVSTHPKLQQRNMITKLQHTEAGLHHSSRWPSETTAATRTSTSPPSFLRLTCRYNQKEEGSACRKPIIWPVKKCTSSTDSGTTTPD